MLFIHYKAVDKIASATGLTAEVLDEIGEQNYENWLATLEEKLQELFSRQSRNITRYRGSGRLSVEPHV
ncbi:hypothetical protein A1359_11615 [Methylomonas lenta]|uniref:Uncharacterized protein n=1 Tax=Methylomonas lenta TaxID=980561 RepID=A0A177N7R0_9GAMM|nr:hypothetical protein [Methylomonas lenta]OAI13905.1 hypothetical protein A1359_11615 [Methylomonas lenta]